MNNYHIYEAIGHGKHSAVYKGRKKKSIQYFAIKSVDKSQRSKLLHEVRMLHSLNHPNVLKFYSWYETSAHLWLVLEYCVGGDLRNLLEKDKRLPENCIYDLAHDLVQALMFLHSNGILYCDLKPSNILLNEFGELKLCDFGLSRRLSDIEKSSPATVPQSLRGTPCYMAPELFQEGGVHSFASDLWALGCVIFECFTGRPPFTANEFTKLVKSILSDPTPSLPDNASKAFQNLINSLLIKDPLERLQWHELCEHSFWKTKLSLLPLPPQPCFDSMLQVSLRPCLSERNGDRSAQRTPPRHCQHNGNGADSGKAFQTPMKNVSSRKLSTRPAAKVDVAKGGNILRMSRMAKLNIQRENEKENYRKLPPDARGNEADVRIENNDMELDFSEHHEDDMPDDTDPSEPPSPALVGEKVAEILEEVEGDVKLINRAIEPDSIPEVLEIASTPSSTSLRKGYHRKVASGSSVDLDPAGDLSEIFWHQSDLSVKPVMPSRKGEKPAGPLSTTFEALPASEYAKLSTERQNALNNRIVQCLSGNSHLSEQQSTIKYLEMLSGDSDAANIITNGPVMQLLIKILKISKTPILRIQVVSAMGLLIRHSTFIGADFANSGIMNALTDGLRDKNDKLRRFCMASLGELLFYISTEPDRPTKDNNALESPSKENKNAASWQVPGSVIALVASLLRKGEDDLAQLYALRTIDNVFSQGPAWTARFASRDVVGNLCHIYRSAGKHESTRLIAGSCLVRLARFSPTCTHLIFEKLTLKDVACTLPKGSQREQQISLNLLNLAFLNGQSITTISRQLLALADEKQLAPAVISLIEQGAEVLRGKALLFVALLCKNSQRWLPHFLCNAKLLCAVDRLGKEKDGFVRRCVEVFVQLVAATVPGILDAVSGDVQQMMRGKRHHSAIAALTGRANPKSTLHLFPVVLHLLGSSTFKHRVFSSHVMIQLANLVKLLETPFQGRDDLQITVLRILESVVEEPNFVLNDHEIFTARILPSLTVLYNGNKDGGARFLCLKILFDVLIVIFSEASLSGEDQVMHNLKTISYNFFLPLYPLLIEDEDPVPTYAQKLLVMLIEYGCVRVSDILNQKTVSQCFKFLLGDLSNANVNNVKLCLALASASEMDTRILSQLQLVRRIGNLIEFVTAKGMEDFLEPTLSLCRAFVLRGIGCRGAAELSRNPALLVDEAFGLTLAVDNQSCIKDIGDLGTHMTIFLELVKHPDSQIVDTASDCIVMLLRAAPREATVGALNNLPKICSLLETLQQSATVMPLLRLLYAVAFSFRQYLSHGMILSLSPSALSRLDALLSAFRSTRIPGAVEAAAVLTAELQRLPRV